MLTQAFPKAGPQAPLGPWLGRLPPAHSLEPGGPSHCQDPDDGMREASQPLLPYRVLPGSPLAAHIPSGPWLPQGSTLISVQILGVCTRLAAGVHVLSIHIPVYASGVGAAYVCNFSRDSICDWGNSKILL